MPNKTGKINRWQKEICARVKTIREAIRWSQSDFSDRIGITRDQLASIESARTPLRYSVAWNIREAFGISLRWLAGEDAFADDPSIDDLPLPMATGLPERALLSTVTTTFPKDGGQSLASIGEEERPIPPKSSQPENLTPTEAYSKMVGQVFAGREPSTGEVDIGNRLFWETSLISMIRMWLADVPVGNVFQFAQHLSNHGVEFLSSLPRDPAKVVDERAEKLRWERIKMSVAKNHLVTETLEKKHLTRIDESVNHPVVQPQWPILKKRLRQAADGIAAKSKLAKFIGVKLASVNQWLRESDEAREPGAETALRMLRWVEQQERK